MADDSIQVLSTEKRTFPPSKEFSKQAHIKSMKEYEQLYKKSVDDPEKFWAEMAEKNLTWYKKWDKVLEYDFMKPSIKWFSRRETERLGELPRPVYHDCHEEQGRAHLGSGQRPVQDPSPISSSTMR